MRASITSVGVLVFLSVVAVVTQLVRQGQETASTITGLVGLGRIVQREREQGVGVSVATDQPLPLLPLRTCNKSSFPIPNLTTPSPFVLEYQCQGPQYDNFTARLHEFANNLSQNYYAPTWGRRPTPLPANTTVLFLGNSHTMQTLMELVCQYSEQISGWNLPYQRVYRTTMRFDNNSTIYLIYNSPVEADRNWVGRLERIAERSLQSFDAVVLGQFNYAGDDIKNTTFYRNMMNWSANEFGQFEPPTVIHVAQEFHGPIVFASSYHTGSHEKAEKVISVIEDLRHVTNRSNIRGIFSRKYYEALGGTECGTNGRLNLGRDCGTQGVRLHRCVGLKGGHPTLIAHDVQEALFSLLSIA